MESEDLTNLSYTSLCERVNRCRNCTRMNSSSQVIGLASGPLDAEIMLIGEAPGRLGADKSGIPFHGDKSGDNFEALLESSNFSRERLHITNAVLCNPRDDKGNNSRPTKIEITNCTNHLAEQLRIIDPRIVVTLGSVALDALNRIHPHHLVLKTSVGQEYKWNNRLLFPLYHPGQRAMLHRSMEYQKQDYSRLAKLCDAMNIDFSVECDLSPLKVRKLIIFLAENFSPLEISLFHLLLYSVEYEYVKKYGRRLTNLTYVVDNELPVCLQLTPRKMKLAYPGILLDKQGHACHIASTSPTVTNKVGAEVIEIVSQLESRLHFNDLEYMTSVARNTAPLRRLFRKRIELGVDIQKSPIWFIC